MERYLPDAFIFVILLTFVVFILGLTTTDTTAVQMVSHFGNGFWGLLAFTLQMAMVLLCGHVMAKSPFFKSLLEALAKAPKTAGGAIIMVSFVSALACWINWGFGLVLGVLIAKEVARQRNDTDYRLLIASSYSGFLVWHGGIAGSIPLSIATEAHPYVDKIGIIPTTDTIFTLGNLLICGILMIAVPLLNYFMHPAPKDRFIIDKVKLQEPEPEPKPSVMTPAERLEHSAWLNYIIGFLGFAYVVHYFYTKGFDLNLNIINFISSSSPRLFYIRHRVILLMRSMRQCVVSGRFWCSSPSMRRLWP